jgi:hypothetical protein
MVGISITTCTLLYDIQNKMGEVMIFNNNET